VYYTYNKNIKCYKCTKILNGKKKFIQEKVVSLASYFCWKTIHYRGMQWEEIQACLFLLGENKQEEFTAKMASFLPKPLSPP